MPDEDFDQLVRDWAHAAEAMASATADVTRDVVLKLYTLARLIGVGGIGTRELEMIEWIRWDMRRLAAVRPVATLPRLDQDLAHSRDRGAPHVSIIERLATQPLGAPKSFLLHRLRGAAHSLGQVLGITHQFSRPSD